MLLPQLTTFAGYLPKLIHQVFSKLLFLVAHYSFPGTIAMQTPAFDAEGFDRLRLSSGTTQLQQQKGVSHVLDK